MRKLLWLICGGVGLGGFLASPPESPDVTLLFSSDLMGYLSPCGCNKPQLGGIRRLATVVREMKKTTPTVYVDAGNWTLAGGRQDQLKAEALAELFKSLDAGYINVGSNDVLLGSEQLSALIRISEGRVMSSNLELGTQNFAVKKIDDIAFVGLANEDKAKRVGISVAPYEELFKQLVKSSKQIVVLLSDGKNVAIKLAEAYPQIGLIIYSTKGDPPRRAEKIGNTTLVSVGGKGQYLGRIEKRAGEWTNFQLIQLGPDKPDDDAATRIYKAYLNRVDQEDLLGEIPRLSTTEKYVGNQQCISCHQDAGEVWLKSAHARAYPTLEETGNHRDPECVGCHVVGLTAESGFKSLRDTPDLSNVGCESCHGPGSQHILDPYKPYGQAGERSCMQCHVPDHSPAFDFKTYWEMIRH